jgi:hypothetical protein
MDFHIGHFFGLAKLKRKFSNKFLNCSLIQGNFYRDFWKLISFSFAVLVVLLLLGSNFAYSKCMQDSLSKEEIQSFWDNITTKAFTIKARCGGEGCLKKDREKVDVKFMQVLDNNVAKVVQTKAETFKKEDIEDRLSSTYSGDFSFAVVLNSSLRVAKCKKDENCFSYGTGRHYKYDSSSFVEEVKTFFKDNEYKIERKVEEKPSEEGMKNVIASNKGYRIKMQTNSEDAVINLFSMFDKKYNVGASLYLLVSSFGPMLMGSASSLFGIKGWNLADYLSTKKIVSKIKLKDFLEGRAKKVIEKNIDKFHIEKEVSGFSETLGTKRLSDYLKGAFEKEGAFAKLTRDQKAAIYTTLSQQKRVISLNKNAIEEFLKKKDYKGIVESIETIENSLPREAKIDLYKVAILNNKRIVSEIPEDVLEQQISILAPKIKREVETALKS